MLVVYFLLHLTNVIFVLGNRLFHRGQVLNVYILMDSNNNNVT